MLYPQYQRLMKFCMLCSVMIILPCGTTSYSAVFGTTRYGRSSIPSHRTATSTQWIPASYGLPLANYKTPRVSSQIPANYPGFYYEPFYNPYPQDYFDEYFYPQQDPLAYPLYYAPPTRNSKYEPYQTFPYFYDDRRMRQPIPYEFYNTAADEDSYPMTDLQDRMLQDDPKDFDNDGLDQDDWYENDLREQQPDINNDNANSAFLHNLILSQMYNDALKKQNKWKTNGLDQVSTEAEENNDYYDKSEDDTWPDNEYQSTKIQDNFDDKNEDALKMLENYQTKHSNDIKRLRKYEDEKPDKKQKSTLSMDPNDTNMWINWYNKRNLNTEKINKKQETLNHGLWSPIHKKLTFSDRKNIHSTQTVMPKEVSTTQNPITTSTTISSTNVPISSLKLNVPNNKKTGQKEFVLLRPATPVRHPFTEPILELLAQQKNQNDVKRSPSVYNTIKQLLNMEDNFKEDEAVFNHNSNHKNLKKRYVTSENTLVNELKELKKTSY